MLLIILSERGKASNLVLRLHMIILDLFYLRGPLWILRVQQYRQDARPSPPMAVPTMN